MTHCKQPWLERWEIVTDDESRRGGQGETVRVKRIADGEVAILKKLKNQKSSQARARMYQEVANLRVLHQAGCKVPKVLDGNTDDFEQSSVHLYFVMQCIEGPTLFELVREAKPLGLPDSIKLVLDLAATMKTALDNGVIHRDLKPDNIVVRSLDDADAVVVDYGLSFNHAEGVELTRQSESLDNEFLSLPERRVDGGDRRDPRSDLTGLCALLYFCLTGKRPRDLRDAEDQPPHRRPEGSIRNSVPDAGQAQALEAFFDRGFAQSIDRRFQTIAEIESRLAAIRDRAAQVVTEAPTAVAARISEELRRMDRPTQLAEMNRTADRLIALFSDAATAVGDLGEFRLQSIGRGNSDLRNVRRADLGENLWATIAFELTCPVHGDAACGAVVYQVGAQEMECVLQRTPLNRDSQKNFNCTSASQEVLRFDSLGQLPDKGLIRAELNQWVVSALEAYTPP